MTECHQYSNSSSSLSGSRPTNCLSNINTSGDEYQCNNDSLDLSMDVSETNSCAETTSSNNTGATSDSNNGTSSAGGSTGLAKSVRYKMAMTTRARQRRLRRMRDPSGGPCAGDGRGGGDGMDTGTIEDGCSGCSGEEQLTPPPSGHSRGEVRSSVTVINDASSGSAALPPALPKPYSSSFTEHSSNVIDIQPIKSYDSSNTNEFGRSTPSKPVAPITATAPTTPSTVGETPPRHSPSSNSVSSRNSRTLFHVSTYESPLSAAASANRNSSPISTTTATREENESIRDNMGGMRSTPSPHIMTTPHSQLPSTPRTTRQTAIRSAALREQPCSAIAQTTKEFLPNWDTDMLHNGNRSGTCVGLSDDAIREASNFTKIQFQCSGQGGEVEMVSGDELTFDAASDDATKKMNGGGYCDLSPSSIPSAIGGIDDENDDEDNNNDDQGKQVWQNDLWSDVSAHSSSMAQYDIFHQKAASNLVSLLSPNRMIEAGLMAPEINSCEEDDAAKDVRGDSPWDEKAGSPLKEGTSSQVKKHFTFDADPNDSRGGEWKGVVQVNRTFIRDDLDDDVKQSMIFQAFRKNMMEPSQQLKDLLLQIYRDKFTPLDRTYATRRKNSCGALKILSAKEENKLMICWTVGVLPAIASVLSDVCAVRETDDASTYASNTEARNRIISTLLNLSVNKKNRMLIVNTPGVLDSMTQTILHDTGEGRQGCCTVFLYLAKTAEARMMIVKGVGVMDALAKVIEMPKANVKERKPASPKAKMRRRLIENYKSMDNDTTQDKRRSRLDNRRNSRRYQSSIDHSDSDSVSSNSSNSSNSSTISGDVTEYTEDMSIKSEVMVANTVEMAFSTADTASIANGTKSDKSAVTTIEPPSEDLYDADPNRFLHGARLSVFACLLCLVKSQELAVSLFNIIFGSTKNQSAHSHPFMSLSSWVNDPVYHC